jgi:hypothetical protein
MCSLNTKNNLQSDHVQFVHLSFDPKTWNDHLHDLQLLTARDTSQWQSNIQKSMWG